MDRTASSEVASGRLIEINRHFSTEGTSPFDQCEWKATTALIKDQTGKIVFQQEGVEFPSHFSPMAVNVVSQKYFYGPQGRPGVSPIEGGREHSFMQLVHRVARTITDWGLADGYFDADNSDVFYDELRAILLDQRAAFNSPVWFNLGLGQYYNVKGLDANFRWHSTEKKVVRCEDSYWWPQVSACFITRVEDNMESIMSQAAAEARLFKFGSGVGFNLSTLRSCRERLTGGGRPSGPLSFFKVYDTVAGVVKSGGVTRRAARLQCLNMRHPDILEFIRCKGVEEKKAKALIAAGYPSDYNGEAYGSVAFQNTNISVRPTDQFMGLAISGDEETLNWQTLAVTTGTDKNTLGEPMPAYNASWLLDQLAFETWSCGDPGVQFEDTIQRWHTAPSHGHISASNPCQPEFASVLTPKGIRPFGSIRVGSTIWSGNRWTKVTRKVATGIKEVFEYRTTAGTFFGTADHRVISKKARVRASDAETIDVVVGPKATSLEEIDPSHVMDGWVFGDGSYCKASNLVVLYIGREDGVIHEALGPLVRRNCPGIGELAWEVETSIVPDEVPHTYERFVPPRFYFGDTTMVRGFLRGLYAANGSVCGGRVTLKAASLDVIQQVQEMLSSLGIPSYYTTNKANDIEWSNGTYTSKQSYDLNITYGRETFRDLIGFVHEDKAKRLDEACAAPPCSRPAKTTYEVKEAISLGDHEVFDIEVEADEHTYWTGGLLVSNCSEYLHVDNSACNLASINWLRFLSEDGTFDVAGFKHACRIMFIAMDILIDRASYPTEKIAENSHRLRPLGQGPANVGGLLMAGGLPYGSREGRDLAATLMAIQHLTCLKTSAELADALGAFEDYDANREACERVVRQHCDAAEGLLDRDRGIGRVPLGMFEVLSELIQCVRTRRAFRNSQSTVAAPTGTIAFMMDCSTTGIEPELALVKYKNLAGGGMLVIANPGVERVLKGLQYTPSMIDAILSHLKEHGTLEPVNGVESGLSSSHLPIFDCAFPPAVGDLKRSISWRDRVDMVAALQPFISGGLSVTFNMPENATVKDVRDAYVDAWKKGIKCVSIYRDNCKSSQPLSTSKPKDETEKPAEAPATTEGPTRRPERIKLPRTRPSLTHHFEIGDHSGYFTVGLFADGSPGELFITMSKEGSTLAGLADTIGILFSHALQHGVPIGPLCEKLKNTRFDPAGFTTDKHIRFATSLVDYLAKWLEMAFVPGAGPEAGAAEVSRLLCRQGGPLPEVVVSNRVDDAPAPAGRSLSENPLCGNCGALTTKVGRCHTCFSCGTSIGNCGGG